MCCCCYVIAEALRARLEPVLAEAETGTADLTAKVNRMEELRLAVLLRFGEDPKSAEIEELFSNVVEFLHSWTGKAALFDASLGGGSNSAVSKPAQSIIDGKLADISTGKFRQSDRR